MIHRRSIEGWIWINFWISLHFKQIFSSLTPEPDTGHTATMSLRDYWHDALDLALVARRAISTKDSSILVPYLERAETLVRLAAGLRAEEREARTGVSAQSLEEETQALLVAVLRSDPLAWSQGRVGVVDCNHSPQGAAKSRFQSAAMKRAGAGAGWPDLDVRLVTSTGPLALLLELKVGKGRESKEQRERRERLVSAGFAVRVARGFSEALLIVVELLIGKCSIGEISVEVPF